MNCQDSIHISILLRSLSSFQVITTPKSVFERRNMQGGEELSIDELASNLSTYKDQLQQVFFFPLICNIEWIFGFWVLCYVWFLWKLWWKLETAEKRNKKQTWKSPIGGFWVLPFLFFSCCFSATKRDGGSVFCWYCFNSGVFFCFWFGFHLGVFCWNLLN